MIRRGHSPSAYAERRKVTQNPRHERILAHAFREEHFTRDSECVAFDVPGRDLVVTHDPGDGLECMAAQRLSEAHIQVLHESRPVVAGEQSLEHLAVARHFEDAFEDHCAPPREAVKHHDLGQRDRRHGVVVFFPEDFSTYGVLADHCDTPSGKVVLNLPGDGGLPRRRVFTEDHKGRR